MPARPMPRKATLANFLTVNMFDELDGGAPGGVELECVLEDGADNMPELVMPDNLIHRSGRWGDKECANKRMMIGPRRPNMRHRSKLQLSQ